ncbi:hypothetical protein L7F22_036695 [Adiantum nelumboides]|nr:hypothetical protein [Adiantum nelumboides]
MDELLYYLDRICVLPCLASWEEYLPLVEFAYNYAPHSATGITPFQAAYGHTPLVPTNFVLQHKVALADQLVQEMQGILVQVRDKLAHVQQKYQKQANKHCRHAEFNEGDLVLLYVASHRFKRVKSVFPKLRPRFYGSFKIIKKNSVVSYKLELPPLWGKLHPTFHISWLKQYIQGDSSVPELSSYVPEIEDEHVILVPEMILDVRQKETRRKLTTEFLVKWMDLDESESTWQTDEEMQQYPNLPQEFFDKRQIFHGYDVESFSGHRLVESADPEVRVRFAGFGPEEDEWVNVRTGVRQRSLPCEAAECVAVLPGDLILCFQEGSEQALYFDARIKEVERRRHDVRGCRCRFLVEYDHDNVVEIVPLRKVCRRPETEYRLQGKSVSDVAVFGTAPVPMAVEEKALIVDSSTPQHVETN